MYKQIAESSPFEEYKHYAKCNGLEEKLQNYNYFILSIITILFFMKHSYVEEHLEECHIFQHLILTGHTITDYFALYRPFTINLANTKQCIQRLLHNFKDCYMIAT